MATAKQAIAKARSQVGVTEKGYSNVVKYNDVYWGKGKYGSWAAWCSVFLGWVSDQIGMRKNIDYPWSAGVAVCFAWFIQHGRKVSKSKLQPGDWCRFTFSHVALVREKPSGGTIKTIEGNTSLGSSGSQRDGGGVWLRTRPLSLIQYGGRPNYGAAAASTPKPATPAPKKEGLFGMAVTNAGATSKKVKLNKGKYKTLPINEKGDVSITSELGKGDSLLATVQLSLSGLPAGAEAQGRFYYADYKRGSKTKRHYTFPTTELVGTGGGSFGTFTQLDRCGSSPAKGWSRRLRFELVAFVDGVQVTRTTIKVAK